MTLIWILTAVSLVLLTLLLISYGKNKKLKQEVQILKEIVSVKDTTIENLHASRVAVKDVIENFSVSDDVMQLLEQGLKKEDIAAKLDMPVDKVDLIIKFDRIKKDNASS